MSHLDTFSESLQELEAARAGLDDARAPLAGARLRLTAAQWNAVLAASRTGRLSTAEKLEAIKLRDKSAASKARTVLETAEHGRTVDGRIYKLDTFSSLGAAYAAALPIAKSAKPSPSLMTPAVPVESRSESSVLDWIAVTVATADDPSAEADRLRTVISEALNAARDAAEEVRGVLAPGDVPVSRFAVVLDHHGGHKIQIIKVIRDMTGAGLSEAKELSELPGSVIITTGRKADAEAAARRLGEWGATARVEEVLRAPAAAASGGRE